MKNEMKEKRYRIILNEGTVGLMSTGGDYYERVIYTPLGGGKYRKEYKSSCDCGPYCKGCGRSSDCSCPCEIVESLPEGGEWIG